MNATTTTTPDPAPTFVFDTYDDARRGYVNVPNVALRPMHGHNAADVTVATVCGIATTYTVELTDVGATVWVSSGPVSRYPVAVWAGAPWTPDATVDHGRATAAAMRWATETAVRELAAELGVNA